MTSHVFLQVQLVGGHVLEEPHHTDLQTIGIKKFNDLVAADKRVES